MPWDRRRQGEIERSPSALRRPSNPTSVARAVAPPRGPRDPGRPLRGKKKGRAGAAAGPLPASVTLGVARVLRGEPLSIEDAAGVTPDGGPSAAPGDARWGVLYRLVVRDADGKPIPAGMYTIRRHLLHLSSAGCFAAAEKGARIDVVALDAESGAFDFVGLPEGELAPPATSVARGSAAGGARSGHHRAVAAEEAREEAGEERLIEYFSFEMGGVTVAIPRSGFVRARTRRGGRLEIVRTPRASGSVHGAVVPGLVSDGGGDTYVLALRG